MIGEDIEWLVIEVSHKVAFLRGVLLFFPEVEIAVTKGIEVPEEGVAGASLSVELRTQWVLLLHIELELNVPSFKSREVDLDFAVVWKEGLAGGADVNGDMSGELQHAELEIVDLLIDSKEVQRVTL